MQTGRDVFGENFTLHHKSLEAGFSCSGLSMPFQTHLMGFTLKHTSVLSNNKGREMQSQVVWRDTVAHEHQVFYPVLKPTRRPGCPSVWHDQLAGPQAHNYYLGGTEPSPCFEERSKSHIILIKTELFCCHLSLQGCAQIATYAINFRGAALKSVAWSYLLKASVLKAGGCGEHCEKKCFCILNFSVYRMHPEHACDCTLGWI